MPSETIRVCRICGISEDEHHDFSGKEMPADCNCDPMEWDDDNIGPICEQYAGVGRNCTRCEHGKTCHAK